MKRSNEIKGKHVEEAKRLLSLGYGPSAVSLRLQRLFSISRATSFRDVALASTQMQNEDIVHDVDAPIPMLEQRDAMLRDLEQAWMEASAQHNVQELMQLSRAFGRLHRMGGHQSQKY